MCGTAPQFVGDGALDVPKGYILTESKNVGDVAPDVPKGYILTE